MRFYKIIILSSNITIQNLEKLKNCFKQIIKKGPRRDSNPQSHA